MSSERQKTTKNDKNPSSEVAQMSSERQKSELRMSSEKSRKCRKICLIFPQKKKNIGIEFKSLGNSNLENKSNFNSPDSNLYNEEVEIPDNIYQKSYPKEKIITPEIYECEYCSLEFKTRANLKRHQIKSCKFKKHQEESDLIASLQKDKEKMLEIHEKEKEEYRRQIEILLDKVGTTNITNTNCGNTQTNNVQLNNFGQEDLTMLTDKYMNKMVAYPYSAIPTMIKKIHFNDKYPANRNIRMLNKKDNKLQIRNNGEWQYVNKKETLQLLIEDKNYQLENYYENNKEKFDTTKQSRFESFQEQVNLEDKKVSDSIKKDTELVFWNSM